MGKIVKKKRPKPKKVRFRKEFETAADQTLNDLVKPKGEELNYRTELQTHLLAVCREVLDEQRQDIIKRAEERILALRNMKEHV